MSKSALTVLSLLAFGAFVLISCKSDEQQLLDWYHENYDDMKSGLPPKEVCDRWLPAYSAMNREVEIASEQFQSEIDHVNSLVRQGYMTPDQGAQMREPIATAWSAWLRNRNEAFWNQTQIPGPARDYCFIRLLYDYVPDQCSDAAQRIIQYSDIWASRDLTVFTTVEYCLENWPGFLETG